ncbi:hypothetical protein TeGR_g6083 [Tetraparma gracilis]|uniref:Lecithin:cholesterol acyltransferase n=1 Tax=Tetraparma gracilis TaxID=2962635 RepID=A0ABQ6NBB3_9STRA|nr:hypothetical protein TeGR_g6083 [Tetraparma gracilis]
MKLFLALSSLAAASALHPVLIIPGTGGNRMEAKLDKPDDYSSVHFYCSKKADWYDLWLDAKQLVPGAVDCWAENIKQIYDAETDTFSNNVGVETRVPCFGDVCGIEYLDTSIKFGGSAYFHDMIEAFAAKGYVRGDTIVSAPYDFRLAAKRAQEYIANTVALVESLYEKDQQKVLLVSHSMGGLWSHYLLANQSAEWKAKYILAWVPLAPAYGGTANEMKLMSSGAAEGVPLANGMTVREEQRSYESNLWLLPNPDLWGPDEVIIEGPDSSYSAHDLAPGAGFWDEIGYSDGNLIYAGLDGLFDISDVGVETHVKYGVGKDTPEKYTFSKGKEGDWDEKYITDTVMGDGDGTVNRRGLESGLAMGWENCDHEAFDGDDHQSILKNEKVINFLVDLGVGSAAGGVAEVL